MEHLLLLHGALGLPDDFSELEKSLSTRFRVHKLLFAGHGNTPIPAKGLNMELYVDQIAAYIAGYLTESFHIFGYSMGGYAALACAAQYPGQIRSVLTLATKLQWSPEAAAKESAFLQPDIIATKVPRYAAQLAERHGATRWKHLLSGISGLMERLGTQPLLTEKVLAGIDIPVQIMVGDRDNMVSMDESREASTFLKSGRFAVLPGTAHPFEKVRNSLLLSLMYDFWAKHQADHSSTPA